MTYQLEYSGRYPMYIAETSINRHVVVAQLLGGPVKNNLIVCHDGDLTSYTTEDHTLAATQQRYLDRNFVKQILQQSAAVRQAYATNPAGQTYNELDDHLIQLFAYFELTRMEYVDILADAARQTGLTDDDLFLPPEPDPLIEEEHAWNTLMTTNPGDDELLAYGKEHLWLFPGCKDDTDLLAELHGREHGGGRDLAAYHAEIEKRKEKQAEQLRNNHELRDLITSIHELGAERFRLKRCWEEARYYQNQHLDRIAAETGVPYETLLKAYCREDIKSLRDGEALPEQTIKERRTYAFTYDGTVHFAQGVAAEQLLHDAEAATKTETLTGMPTYQGRARGRVVIVPHADSKSVREATANFKKGDILVTAMTQPNMVMLMRKAAAIVTNEGGIACHAAILSRELRVPCIVGTIYATRNLKDGDVVEVDAENGVVRKL